MKKWVRSQPGTAGETRRVDHKVPLPVSLAIVHCMFRIKQPNCGCENKWRCKRDEADVTWSDCVTCKTQEVELSNQELNHWRGGV